MILSAVIALSLSAPAAPGFGNDPHQCRAVPQGTVVVTPEGTHIRVHTVGAGRPVVMIPSLGRSVADFDEVAGRLVSAGFMTILPEVRGINGSEGAPPTTLFDLAADTAAVVEHLCNGPVDVVGHAFGNRVARAFATRRPDLVRRVVLLAGGGAVPISDEIKNALAGSYSQGTKPDDERLQDLQLAFFARGNDPSRWLSGWYPSLAKAQTVTVQSTPASQWWNAGKSPVLLVQAGEDPIAPPGNMDELKEAIGPRLTQVTLLHASHAILPEQPAAVATAIEAYLGCDLPLEADLQKQVNDATVASAQGVEVPAAR
jgi:pimeloyl-ACP methyl ester carboxylesterase